MQAYRADPPYAWFPVRRICWETTTSRRELPSLPALSAQLRRLNAEQMLPGSCFGRKGSACSIQRLLNVLLPVVADMGLATAEVVPLCFRRM